jgi:hypothetical protein
MKDSDEEGRAAVFVNGQGLYPAPIPHLLIRKKSRIFVLATGTKAESKLRR